MDAETGVAAGLSDGGDVGERGSEEGGANDDGTTLPPAPRPMDGSGGGVCTTACRWEDDGREDDPLVAASEPGLAGVRMNTRDGPSLLGLPGREDEDSGWRVRMSVVLIRRDDSVTGRGMFPSVSRTAKGEGKGRGGPEAEDTLTELGRERGGGDELVNVAYLCPCPKELGGMDDDVPLPDLRTLVWKGAVRGRATLGPVDERGRWVGSAFCAPWRPTTLGRRDEDTDEPRRRGST